MDHSIQNDSSRRHMSVNGDKFESDLNRQSSSIPIQVPQTDDNSIQTLSSSTVAAVTGAAATHSTSPIEVNTNSATQKCEPTKCAIKDFLTCIALSLTVIGFPIVIIILLINLPRLSPGHDTRQQHYLLLAFGFPFSLVVIVYVIHAISRIIKRIRTGPDHSKYLQTQMSWRQLSRQLHDRRIHHSKQCTNKTTDSIVTMSDCFDDPCLDDIESSIHSSQITFNDEPKLYSLVNEVMSKQNQIYPETFHSIRTNMSNQKADICNNSASSPFRTH